MSKVAVSTYLLIIALTVNGLHAPVERRMDEEVAHRCNEVLPGHEKGWNLTTCANMEGPRGNYAKGRSQTVKDNTIWLHFYVKNKINEQIKQINSQIQRTNEWLPGGTGVGGWVEKLKGLRGTNWWLHNSPGKSRTAQVSDIITTMRGVRQVQGLSGGITF